MVWSSESAPIRIQGTSPVRCARLARALRKKEFGEVVPTQSGHRSCSIESDSRAGLRVAAEDGGERGKETETAWTYGMVEEMLETKRTPRSMRENMGKTRGGMLSGLDDIHRDRLNIRGSHYSNASVRREVRSCEDCWKHIAGLLQVVFSSLAPSSRPMPERATNRLAVVAPAAGPGVDIRREKQGCIETCEKGTRRKISRRAA